MSSYNYEVETSSSESEDETYSRLSNNINNLQPYDFEPDATTSHLSQQSDNVVHMPPSKKGHTNWCICGKCRRMETEDESKCCREPGEVPGEYFGEHECITNNENFQTVCLHNEVLKTTLFMLNNVRDGINISNQSTRYAGYRQYTWWVHNRLGKGVRKVIPSCAIWAIRDTYPETSNNYVPFQEARDEINA